MLLSFYKKSPLPSKRNRRPLFFRYHLKIQFTLPAHATLATTARTKTQQGLARSKLLPNRMSRWSSPIASWEAAILSMALVGAGALPSPLFADSPTPAADTAQIECITPDGRLSAISHAHVGDPNSAATIIDDTTVSCPLAAGDTTFVIALPTNALRDRFTVINENAAACGELKIAVADSRLAADSPKWMEVDGIIPFSHKRLFNLSILGVETRFVRLSFHVEIAPEDSTDPKVAWIRNTFHFSVLEAAIKSHFAVSTHARRTPIGTSFGSFSVAPLFVASNR
jgi:hypothetical protein